MKTLKLEDVRKELNLKIQTGVAADYLKNIADPNRNTIDFDVFLLSKGKNLQRPFCWTWLQKQELIFSVLKGIKIPNISVIIYKDDSNKEKEITVLKIIDGKQRLSTLISFYKGEFPINYNGVNYFYNNLDEKAKSVISFLNLTTDRVYEYYDDLISDDDKIAWFEMINFLGTPQDAKHLENLKS